MRIIKSLVRSSLGLHRRKDRFVESHDYRVAESHDFFASTRNKYLGRRGFVIGNGPSLRIEDLSSLSNEITIASNKVYLAFGQTKWRPSIYTIVDPLVWDKINDQLPGFDLTPIVQSYLPSKPIKQYTTRYLGNSADLYETGAGDFFSTDASVGLYGGYSVTFENLQLAFHLGLNPIYIIGCDHYYAGECDSPTPNSAVTTNSTSNHFLPNYRSIGETVNPAPISKMTIAYEVAARIAQKSNVQILNATRGGYLEAFPRVDFDHLLTQCT